MLRTIGGYWDAIPWIIGFIVISIVAYVIRSMGKKEYRKEAETPFLSAVEVSKEKIHVRASNIYWGFLDSLKNYYNTMKRIHRGMINDYVAWFVSFTALLFIIMFLIEVIP